MEPSLLDPLSALRDVIAILDQLKIPYSVGGSFASGIYGKFRATQDIDIVVAFDSKTVAPFIQCAKENFFIDEVSAPRAINTDRAFNIIHRHTAFKVDVFTKKGDFEQQQITRAVEIEAYGADLKIRILSAEDCILAKLRWYRSGDCSSERQWNDLMEVFRMQRQRLDSAYLQDWARRLGLEDLLTRVKESAE